MSPQSFQTFYATISAQKHLAQGQLLIYPTESVYGIGALATSLKSLSLLRTIKERPKGQGWILLGNSIEQFQDYIDISALSIEQTAHLIPCPAYRPITWIVPCAPTLPKPLLDDRGGLAIRLSQFLPLKELCSAFNCPIISTSVNLRGEEPIKTRAQLKKFLKNYPSIAFWDRPLGPSYAPSTIMDLRTKNILRYCLRTF